MAFCFSAGLGHCVMSRHFRHYHTLTPEEERVIINKGTESPGTGRYNDFFQEGTYICKRCNSPLFRSEAKFESHSGWPGFDDEVEGAIKRVPDPDGVRIEIQCANCGAHLGHVFEGEGFTPKNVRYCVNSISLIFIPDKEWGDTAKAYFAGGCFWGVEYRFEKKEGVISAVSGYMGGTKENPTYEEICSGTTGHYEVVEVTYDPKRVTFEELAKSFFEIHDPTQPNGQGPDIGEQYQSVLFYSNGREMEIGKKLIRILKAKGYNVVTRLLPVTEFYTAEEYHQDYYKKHKETPYCHIYRKRF